MHVKLLQKNLHGKNILTLNCLHSINIPLTLKYTKYFLCLLLNQHVNLDHFLVTKCQQEVVKSTIWSNDTLTGGCSRQVLLYSI